MWTRTIPLEFSQQATAMRMTTKPPQFTGNYPIMMEYFHRWYKMLQLGLCYCKDKRQYLLTLQVSYLLTLQVSRYFLLALQIWNHVLITSKNKNEKFSFLFLDATSSHIGVVNNNKWDQLPEGGELRTISCLLPFYRFVFIVGLTIAGRVGSRASVKGRPIVIWSIFRNLI